MKFLNEDEQLKFIKKLHNFWLTDQQIDGDIADKLLNILFVKGKQYHFWNRGLQTIQPKEKVTPVVSNMMLQYLEMMKARVLSMNARPVVSASTNDYDKKVKARGYSKAYRGILKQIRFNSKLQRMVDIMMKCKGVWLYPFWNEDLKDGKFKGNLDFEIMHDITAVIDPFCDSDENIRYVMFFDLKSDKWIREKYNITKQIERKESLNYTYDKISTVFKVIHRYPFDSGQRPIVEDGVLLFTLFYYDEKSAIHKVIATSSEILEDKIVRHFPTYVRCYHDGLGFYGETPLSDLRSAQREINEILTRIKATLRKPAKLFVNDKHVSLSTDIDTYDDTANEIVHYDSDLIGERPQVVAPPPVNTIDFQMWLRQFSEVGGLSESSKGNLASSQLSKIAIQFLSQQDETKLGNIKDNLQEGLEKVLSDGMDIIDAKYNEARMVKVFGRSYSYEAVVWEKMGDERDIYTVHMDMGSNLPTSPMQRLELMMNLNQGGLFEDIPNKLSYIRDTCDISPYDLDNVDPDIDKQWAEIYKINNQESAPTSLIDDDIKHISVLQQYMKSTEFEKLDSKIQAMHHIHLQTHMAKFWSAHKDTTPQGNTPAGRVLQNNQQQDLTSR